MGNGLGACRPKFSHPEESLLHFRGQGLRDARLCTVRRAPLPEAAGAERSSGEPSAHNSRQRQPRPFNCSYQPRTTCGCQSRTVSYGTPSTPNRIRLSVCFGNPLARAERS